MPEPPASLKKAAAAKNSRAICAISARIVRCRPSAAADVVSSACRHRRCRFCVRALRSFNQPIRVSVVSVSRVNTPSQTLRRAECMRTAPFSSVRTGKPPLGLPTPREALLCRSAVRSKGSEGRERAGRPQRRAKGARRAQLLRRPHPRCRAAPSGLSPSISLRKARRGRF